MKLYQTTLSKDAEDVILANFDRWDKLNNYTELQYQISGTPMCSQDNCNTSPSTFESLCRFIFLWEKSVSLSGSDQKTSLTFFPMGKKKHEIYDKAMLSKLDIAWTTSHSYADQHLEDGSYDITMYVYCRTNAFYARKHGIENNYQRWTRMFHERNKVKDELKPAAKALAFA